MSFVDEETQIATAKAPVGSPADPGDPTRAENTARARVAGRQIGRYLLIEEVGRGGMGVVYAAYDPELDRKVAIKLLRRGLADDGARLRREAQAMARLSHPNVAAVFDVGQHEGRLFLAMDFVEGQTLKAWLEGEQKRPWREVLEVFLRAAQGLAAAHAADLVHRDFKPDNVLVAHDGEVKVVDFGIAKEGGGRTPRGGEAPTEAPVETRATGGATGTNTGANTGPDTRSLGPVTAGAQDLTPPPRDTVSGTGELGRGVTGGRALSTPLTEVGSIMGTPAYMSPEQHRGLPTDARSDQFSFAVSLWEGLFGERPFQAPTAAALRFAVCRGDRADPPRDHEVPRYLQRALERALSVDPGDRFEDMAALAEALATDPDARRRRRRGGLLAGGGILAAALGLAMWSPARDACDGAQALGGAWSSERRAALVARFEGAGPAYAGATATRAVALLDARAQAWIDAYEAECQPARADRYAALACLEDRRRELEIVTEVLIDGPDEALPDTVEHAVALVSGMDKVEDCSAPELARLAARIPPPPPTLRDAVHEVEANLAQAEAVGRSGRRTDAVALAEAATRHAQKVPYLPLHARAKLVLGRRLADDYRHAEAAVLLHEAEVLAAMALDDRSAAEAQIGLARLVIGDEADLARGARVLERAAASVARLGPVPELEVEMLSVWGMHASVAANFEEARSFYEAALERRREDLAEDAVGLGGALDELAQVHKRLGNQDEAERLAKEAHASLVGALGEHHPGVTGPLFTLGRVYRAQDRARDSIAAYRQVIEIRTAALGPRHPSTLLVYNNLANAYTQAGEREAAIEALRVALEARIAAHGPRHQRVATVRMNLAGNLLALGELDSARVEAESAVAIYTEVFGPAHRNTQLAAITLAEVELAEGRDEQALALAADALTRLPAAGDAIGAVADAHFVMARALHRSGGESSEVAGAIEEARHLYAEVGRASDLAELERWWAERAATP